MFKKTKKNKLVEHNVYFQKMSLTDVKLFFVHNIGFDIYKHAHMHLGNTVILRSLS